MGPVARLSRLLLAVVTIPALGGCAALGLPELPGTSLMPFDAQIGEASPDPAASPFAGAPATEVASADGYSLSVPGGWAASDVSTVDGLGLADALAGIDPILGGFSRLGLEQSGARLSLFAVDTAATVDGFAPGVVVVTMRTRGMDKAAARTAVEDLLAQVPLAAGVVHSVEAFPAGDAHRYDAIVLGQSVQIQIQVYVFRVGGTSFVIGAVAPADRFGASQGAFDEIVKSLRFGV